MTQTVTVTYYLSDNGKRAAILAGRPASEPVVEQMPCDDPATQIDHVTIANDGSLSMTTRYTLEGRTYVARLDAPPATLGDVMARLDTDRAATLARLDEEEREVAERRARKKAELQERQASDSPLIEAVLAALSEHPDDPLPDDGMVAGVYVRGYDLVQADRHLAMTEDQWSRAAALMDQRNEAYEARKRAAKEAKAAAKAERKAAVIAEHGGYWWAAEGGMCDFIGYGCWNARQDKRWAGVFSAPRGIERFLDCPRREQTFSVASLRPGECVQLAGYDEHRKGRRNVSEWFGLVVRNDASGLVLRECGSRGEALVAAAAKI